jgi:hypothetical protein
MESAEDGSRDFQPFKRNSVNLIAAPTNTGKSYLIAYLIRHRRIYFPGNPVGRVVYVYCNSSSARTLLYPPPQPPTPPPSPPPAAFSLEEEEEEETRVEEEESQQEDVEFVHLCLEDFTSPETFLREQDLVVFEDVHFVHPSIELTIDVYTHHLNLCSTFIICQALLDKEKKTRLSPLLSLVHNVLLLFSSNAVARYFKYIVTYFFHDDDTRLYLKQILSFGQRFKQAAWLEVNSIASRPSKHLAVTALNRLADEENPHCFVHPQLFATDELERRQANCFVHMDSDELAHAPPNTFVLVPAKNVIKRTKAEARAAAEEDDSGAGPGGSHKCAEEEKWDQVNEIIENRIEGIFDHAKWRKAKNLAVDILSNPELCVSDDGKWLMMHQQGDRGKGKGKTGTHPISLMDFLLQCTKQQGPNENPSEKILLYRKFVKILLSNSTPAELIKNRGLLGNFGGGRKQQPRRSLQYRDSSPPLQPQWFKAKDRRRRRGRNNRNLNSWI